MTKPGKKQLLRPAQDKTVARLMALVKSNRHAALEEEARAILRLNARHAFALKALSFALLGLGRMEEVPAVVERALELTPQDGELFNNRGIALSIGFRWREAIDDFLEAARRSPEDAEIHKNLGVAYFRMGRWNDAVAALLKAIEFHPGDYHEAIYMLMWSLMNALRFDEAAAVCEALHTEADEHDPGLAYALAYIELRRCDWDHYRETHERLIRLSKNFENGVGSPAHGLCMPYLDSRDHAAIAKTCVATMIPASYLDDVSSIPLLEDWRGRRLRVGYLSEDLRRHPVGAAMSELMIHHDRKQVEVVAYSTGTDDGSALRRHFESCVERFRDVARLSPHELARTIRSDGIDILVDLGAWTGAGRQLSLAIRCAPIQVSWLGYCGTMGHPRLADFLIGDAIATPLSLQPHYTESIVHLPYSLMPLDTRRQVGPLPSRRSEELPDEAFVLSSLNNSYKFNPPLFELWCDLLARLPEAVLWLPRHNDTVAGNLRKEFARTGLDPSRLILANYAETIEQHLTRIQLADLALDTFPYNSHSTGADALWAGVPMVTMLGSTFAGRVGASMVTAAGVPELVAPDEAGYAELVIRAYHDRGWLRGLRDRLWGLRHTAPFFDMRRFARDLEALYFRMASGELKPIHGGSGPRERAPAP